MSDANKSMDDLNSQVKTCSKCATEKKLLEYHNDPSSKDGKSSQCKECAINAARKHYAENKERHRQKGKEWHDKNRESELIRMKIWQAEHKEKSDANKKAWLEKNPDFYRQRYERNKEKILARQAEYRAKNRASKNAQAKEYREANRKKVAAAKLKSYNALRKNSPRFRVLCNLRTRLGRAIRDKASKSATTKELLGCTVDELLTHLEKQFTPGMTWENYGKWEVDHRKPCASFDMIDHAQQRECFHWSNLQPLWKLDNILKSDK